jgi:hypothetical protein
MKALLEDNPHEIFAMKDLTMRMSGYLSVAIVRTNFSQSICNAFLGSAFLPLFVLCLWHLLTSFVAHFILY